MPKPKFTPTRLIALFEDFMSGDFIQKELAEKYEVSCQTIYEIINRKRYKKVELPEHILKFLKKTDVSAFSFKTRDAKKPNAKAKLTDNEIIQLFRDLMAGLDRLALAEKYNLNKETVSRILHRRTYKRVSLPKDVIKFLKETDMAELSYEKRSSKRTRTTKQFIEEAKAIHGDKFDYSKTEYKTSADKLTIICPVHGEFTPFASAHLSGRGCKHCVYDSNRMTKEEFVKKARAVHGDKYDYSKAKYVNKRVKVEITCSDHGSFHQSPLNHIKNTTGCPSCSQSKGERLIADTLTNLGIEFETEKAFEGCEHKGPLLFDFFLPKQNLLIEYDGQQHFKPVEFFGGLHGFEKRKLRDAIKDEWADYSQYSLRRYNYTISEADLVDDLITLV